MAPSAEFLVEMDRKNGTRPLDKVEIILDSGTIDITDYYMAGAEFDQEKGGDVVKLNSGDVVLTFSNHNNYFSKLNAASLFYGQNFYNRLLRYSVGFRLPTNGAEEYITQFTARIQSVEITQDQSRCYITCRDLMSKIIGERLNIYPPGLIPKGSGFAVTYPSAYPPAQNGTYIKATTSFTPTQYPYFATDPTKSLTDGIEYNAWQSNASVIASQRFHIDLGSAKIIKRIYYENHHFVGASTDEGVKNFTLWGSNDASSFSALTYGTNTGWTQLTTAQSTFDQHITSDIADPKYILISNNIAYRYYAFKFADNWGSYNQMGIRRIELQTIIYTPGSANTGTGIVGSIATKPFATVNEDITITLSSASAFSVSGSVSGALGSGTVGTLFTATGNKVRFMITAGTVAFVNGDAFIFTTYKYPQFTAENPAKIIWALLTGHNYDTNAAEDWHDRSLQMDNTQSSANVDIDYASFAAAIANVSFYLTGFVDYNMGANTIIEEILTLCLGSIFIDGDGKVEINIYAPGLGKTLREFAGTKKITEFKTIENIEDLINYCSGSYKAIDGSWPWSDEDFVYEGNLSQTDSDSIINNKIKKSFNFDTKWYCANAGHLSYLFSHLLDKKGTAPLIVYFRTGLDALQTNIIDQIEVSETKSGISNLIFKVTQMKRSFSDKPKKIYIQATNEGSAVNWAFLGSSADEGDGLGWEVAGSQVYDTANAAQKKFAYLSTTDTVIEPRYYIY